MSLTAGAERKTISDVQLQATHQPCFCLTQSLARSAGVSRVSCEENVHLILIPLTGSAPNCQLAGWSPAPLKDNPRPCTRTGHFALSAKARQNATCDRHGTRLIDALSPHRQHCVRPHPPTHTMHAPWRVSIMRPSLPTPCPLRLRSAELSGWRRRPPPPWRRPPPSSRLIACRSRSGRPC